MALPREVVPGRWYMITRRCTQRELLLRPDDETNEAFLYCLGLAAERTGVQLAFTMACANHHHTGIYDPEGRYPEFIEHFHKMAARCLNALRGRRENFWASEQTSVVHLVETEDVIAKMIYALTNPVKDGLVARAHQWPGASSLKASLTGRTITAERPKHFFREKGSAPAGVTLTFVRPPGLEEQSDDAWRTELERRIAEVEALAEAERRKTGRPVMGRAAVLRQSWRERPRGGEPRGGIRPRLAAASKWARIEALQRSRAFLDAYRRAREAFMTGAALIAFPPGTYWRLKPQLAPLTLAA